MSRRSDDEGGFLDRWSRRKRSGERHVSEELGAREDPAEQAAPVDAAEEITPEEVAALPDPHDITLETDIRPFLRRGVPQALKNAALRRVWMLNPAIRDHKDLAVDYAWDWNTPGGVPGFSGDVSPRGVADLIARMNTGRPVDEETAPADEGRAAALPAAEAKVPAAEAAPDVVPAPDGQTSRAGDREDEEPAKATSVPRHGGARPT